MMSDVFGAVARVRRSGQKAALATVVHVDGSAYRREGAKMVVAEDGSTYGTISGGCLEEEVTALALEVIRSGRPRLVHFNMKADEDIVWGLGLGCNGRIDVFVEPLGGEGD